MKKIYVLILLLSQMTFAQFSDDFEDYTSGEPVDGPWWGNNNCGGGPGCDLMATDLFSFTGDLSGLVPGDFTTDVGLDLGNKIFGEWFLLFYMMVPSNKEGYWELKSAYPISSGIPVMGGLYFNPNLSTPGEGYISDCPGAPVFFTFPHDAWFQIYLKVDISSGISLATCHLRINDVDVLPDGTPFTDSAGNIPASLGAINFLSISNNNEFYLDNFCQFKTNGSSCNLGLNEQVIETIMYPNPVKNTLYVKLDDQADQLYIYNNLGQLLMSKLNSNEIDVSKLSDGLYFVEVINKDHRGVERFIKN